MTDSDYSAPPSRVSQATGAAAELARIQSREPTRLLGYLAGSCIGLALAIMVGASLVRQDWMAPPVAMPASGPPWELPVHVDADVVIVAQWAAALLGLAGVAAGLAAVRRGARGPLWLIGGVATVTIVVLAVLPPVGSTDALDYAAYGRLLLLGHNPYVVTPIYLQLVDPVFGRSIPVHWQLSVSLYGPAATIEQYLAARLGGESMARVVLWLKIWNAVAFGAVALALDRVLRGRPAARLRAHLLWTVNPLLLWDLVGAGHVDAMAAASGLGGLLLAGRQEPGQSPGPVRALAAGALVGLGADFKINYALFGLALAWALRRSWRALLLAACGGLAVLGPTYAWLGKPAFMALFAQRDKVTSDSYYLLAGLSNWPGLSVLATLLFAAVALLLLARLPAGDRLRPAIRPALALVLAWLLIWPYQLPWYDAMAICILVLFPHTLLDWVLLARLTAATMANMPGNPGGPRGRLLYDLDQFLVRGLAPVVLLTAAVTVVLLAFARTWRVVRM